MNSKISELFEQIAGLEEEIDTLKKGKVSLATPSHIGLREWTIEKFKVEIKKISSIINPQIPEPYASMSRDEILGGIGQYEKMVLINTNEW